MISKSGKAQLFFYVEVGCFKGGSLIKLSKMLSEHFPEESK